MNDFSGYSILLLLLVIEIALVINLSRYLLATYLEYKQIRQKGKFVQGRISDHTSREDSDNHTQYAPIIEYVADDDKVYTITSDNFRLKRSKANAKVTILYREDDPSQALIDPIAAITSRCLILLFTAGVIILFNLFLFKYYLIPG
jgi:hypothetical protein